MSKIIHISIDEAKKLDGSHPHGSHLFCGIQLDLPESGDVCLDTEVSFRLVLREGADEQDIRKIKAFSTPAIQQDKETGLRYLQGTRTMQDLITSIAPAIFSHAQLNVIAGSDFWQHSTNFSLQDVQQGNVPLVTSRSILAH